MSAKSQSLKPLYKVPDHLHHDVTVSRRSGEIREVQGETLRAPHLQSAITFMQDQHATMLSSLHEEIEKLQSQCNELQFAITMQLPYAKSEDQGKLSELEKLLTDKEKECKLLKEKLVAKDHNERRLRTELLGKEQTESQLRRELTAKEETEQQLRRDLEKVLTQLQRMRRDTTMYERANSISSVAEFRQHTTVPVPPPKSSRGRAFVRPSSLYRRLLGFGSRALGQEETKDVVETVAAAPTPPRTRGQDGPSTIPQLPRLVSRATTSTSSPRPLVRQQIRLNKLSNANDNHQCHTLAIDQAAILDHSQPSEQPRNAS